ncbi:Mitochondrial outer membrane protein porin 2 [Sesamum angolense]|uniref:Mitochondrial outer membrane protein porin 2 n=1 Tax=Sesamum angolense TaxID=2727404 RepID=A0AAE2C5P6_9LAMI|nr:Mitochondrial outer membrane protein porin 2 [Sesamum angolense]
MSKGPGLFLDIGKKQKVDFSDPSLIYDLLTKDYLSDHKFSVSTYSESGVALTTTAAKKGGYSSAVGLNQAPPVDVSLTLGTPTFALGAEAGYETTSGKLTKYTAGITVTKPDSCASVILGDKGDISSLTLLKMKLNNHGTLGAVLQHEVIRKSLVTISSEFDTRALDRTPKFGVSLALKP